MPRLIGMDASGAKKEYVVKGEPLTVGRSSECTIRLLDMAVGRLHAIVERVDGKLRLRDQGSKSGTLVNGTRVEESELHNGDEITIGGTVLKVDATEPARGRAPAREGEESTEEARSSRRQAKREILGGVRLSKRSQLVVKIVCAVISLMCLIGIVWLLAGRRPGRIHVEKRTVVDPMSKPDHLAEEARALTRSAREAEDQNKTDEAYQLLCEAKAKIEEATSLVEELARTHQEKGFEWIERKATQLNTQAQGIRQEWFRLQMQRMREGGSLK